MLQKRLDYGFNGYQVPPTPRAPRSARRRGPIIRKKTEDNQMCAFDLLATVAGKILLEGDVSPPDAAALRKNDIDPGVDAQGSGTEEKNEGFQSMKLKAGDDHVNSGISLAVQEIVPPAEGPLCKDMLNAQGGTSPDFVSVVTNSASDGSRKIDFEDKMVLESDKSEIGCHSSKLSDSDKSNMGCLSNKLGGRYASSYRGGSCVIPKLEDFTKPLMSSGPVNLDRVLFGTRPDVCDSENLKSFSNNNKPSTLFSSYSNSNGKVASFCKEKRSNTPVSPTRDSVKVVSRDDDENSSKCSRPSMKTKKHVPTPRVGNRRIRKLLTSRYWRVALKTKDGDLSDNGGQFQFVYRSRNNGYKRQRSQRIYPLKKRKIFHCLSNTDEGITCDGIYKSTERETMDMTASDLGAIWHGAVGKSPSLGEQDHVSMQSRESHVKLRIKSFRVPELFIELPETATVGSLKKTVMDAVTALLGGGLRVGVLLQGKKIRDDGKTLLQSGILRDDEAEAVGFSLEPNSSQILQPDISEDHGMVIFNDERQLLLRSLPAASMGVHQGTSHATSDYQGTNLSNNFIESDHDSAPSPAEISSAEKNGADSRALVAVPDGNAEALAAIPPMNQKCKRSDMSQRRIRRPFSVSEVEALVRAVERLGTGRWRDVKLRAFDNVKHRTYVDLKDKWKTLVHTARISPQQRRGEPVPQELLDRVLIAHGYWSQQQAKHQQLKQQNEAACLIA